MTKKSKFLQHRHKVHDRTIYEPSNSLPFYAKDCGGGWVCFESRFQRYKTFTAIVSEWDEYAGVFVAAGLSSPVCLQVRSGAYLRV